MTTKKRKTRKGVSAAELKRQIAAMKIEMASKDQIIATFVENDALEPIVIEAESPLSERWEPVLGDVESGYPIYYLDGNDEDESVSAISKVEQDEGMILYKVECGKKVGYFGDIVDAGEQGERWADQSATSLAKNTPTSIRKVYESQEQITGQDVPRNMKSTGPASQALERAYIQPVEKVISKEKMEMLAFMEEELLVLVHDPANPQDIPIPVVWNDGISQYFIRGQEQTIKRKFVEILARCKKTIYTQEAYKDANGADSYRQIPQTGLMYPFQVLQDPNPRGLDWLRAVQNEA